MAHESTDLSNLLNKAKVVSEPQPLVSIGVASYNNAHYIRETLDSILALTYTNKELIIVDDASTDESVALIEEWLASHPEFPARLVRHTFNRGVCQVCNRLVKEAQGEFISMIGSDDIYVPDKLAKQVLAMLEMPPEVGVVFGDISYMDSYGRPLIAPINRVPAQSGDIFIPLLKDNFVPAMSALVRRKCYDEVGLYDETLVYEDFDMWLRIARKFKFIHIPVVMASYRIHNASASFSRQLQMTESTLRLIQKHRDYSPEANQIVVETTRRLAKMLYLLGGENARQWLWLSCQESPSVQAFGMLALSLLNVPASRLRAIKLLTKRTLKI